MIVYRKSVDLVDPQAKNPILMGQMGVNRFTTKKGIYRNARGKGRKIPYKICER